MLLALAVTSSRAEDANTGHLRGAFEADEILHNLTGFVPRNAETPYSEMPSDADAERPKPSIQGWRSEVPAWISEQVDYEGNVDSRPVDSSPPPALILNPRIIMGLYFNIFCKIHQTGFFCLGRKRIRCCKDESGIYTQCGLTANYAFCAAH